jgi:hypothetical protein
MRMRNLSILLLAALFGCVLVGCQSEPAEGPAQTPAPLSKEEQEAALAKMPPEARESARRAMENQGGGYTGPQAGNR